MAYIIDDLLTNLANIGFYDFLLPWLFTFAIVYGLLVKANIFGSVNQRISGILAFIIAFFVSAYRGPDLASYFVNIFGGSSIIIAAILSIMLFAVLIGFSGQVFAGGKHKYGLWAVIIIGILLFATSAGGDFIGIRLGSSMITMIMVLVLLIAVVAFITSGEKAEEKPATKPAGT